MFFLLLFLYLALFAGTISWLRWRRKTRWPFKEGDRLLRGPGEGLRRRLLELEERLLTVMVGTMIASTGVGAGSVQVSKLLGIPASTAGLVALVAILLVTLLGVGWAVRLWQERANCYLGWFGERITAEKLMPLLAQGYFVFHDVPGEPGKRGFNLDHVVVGPTGVTVVETKTRRKGNARPGFKDHEVVFDGSYLDWPWGRDRHGIEQALSEAEWLRKWIAGCTGLSVPVKAVLSLPGWYVREAPSRELRVVNPGFLPDAIRGRGDPVLTAHQVDLLRRQLDQRCRDVEE
ncbi:MAG: NERD domain-containing protein [Verrucomicrobia bacterium]|nr:NERD domain-containing protein [Verrucomicrobiota bacterium]